MGPYLWGWTQLGRWLANPGTLIQDVREASFTFNDGMREEAWDIVLCSATCLESLIVEVSHACAY